MFCLAKLGCYTKPQKVSDFDHEALTDHVETVEFRRKRLKLISKRKLLEIKLAIDPPRQKDQIDIEFLRKHV